MTWGERIREKRLEMGLSMAALARRVGVSGPTIHDWEHGVIKNIEGPNLMKVAQVLGVTANYILTGKQTLSTDPSPPPQDDLEVGPLSHDEVVLVMAWRAWSPERQDIVRALIRESTVQAHPALGIVRNGNYADQLRANRALERGQKRARNKQGEKHGQK